MNASNGALRGVDDTAMVTVLSRALDAADESGLLHDVFAERFVADLGASRRSFADVIGDRRDYIVARAHVIDVLLMHAVAAGARALWHLGAGYDCRPYRLDLPEDFVTIEVDAPAVLARKAALLAGERPRGTVHRLPGDLTNAKRVVHSLAHCHPPPGPVVVVTEGVTPYLSARQLQDLAAVLAPTCHRWFTDVIGPATARWIADRLGRAGARIGVFGLECLDPFTEQGWDVERLVPLMAAVRRLRPGSPAAAVLAAPDGLPDAVASFTRAQI